MSPFPHVRREQVPITDPRWLASTQPDPEPEVDERRGLDGNGAMRASDLPQTAHTWGYCSPPSEAGVTDDLDEETPVKREKCLKVDPEGDYVMPGRCKKPLGHEPPCDWHANHGAFLGDVRRAELAQGGNPPSSGFTQREMEDFSGYVAYAAEAELRDTPSDVLPVRVPGAALRGEEGSGGPGGPDEAVRPGASAFPREVVETWTA